MCNHNYLLYFTTSNNHNIRWYNCGHLTPWGSLNIEDLLLQTQSINGVLDYWYNDYVNFQFNYFMNIATLLCITKTHTLAYIVVATGYMHTCYLKINFWRLSQPFTVILKKISYSLDSNSELYGVLLSTIRVFLAVWHSIVGVIWASSRFLSGWGSMRGTQDFRWHH